MTKSYFSVERDDEHAVLYNVINMTGLNPGDIFYKRTKEEKLILQDYRHLNIDHLNKLVDTLSEDEVYDCRLLLKQ